MPEYLAPGVFLEEVQLKAPSIEGVSTSTTGMVGAAVRGPIVGRPVLVTNMLQFRQNFGGPVTGTGMGSELFYAAQGFFANGGRRVYVVRAAGAGAKAAQFAAKGGYIGRLAPGADAATGQRFLQPTDLLGLSDGTSIQLSMVKDGVTYLSTARAIAAGGVNRAAGTIKLAANIDISPAGPASYAARASAVITTLNDIDVDGLPTTGARPASIVFDAADVGAAGGNIAITARHVAGARGVYASFIGVGAIDDNKVMLKSGTGFYANAWVEIDRGSGASRRFRRVIAVNGLVLTLSGTVLADGDIKPVAPATETVITVREFALTVSYDATTESFPSLTLENVPGKFVTDAINNGSKLIRINAALPAKTNPFLFPSGDDGLNIAVTIAGTDVVPDAAAIRGVDNGPGQRSGLRALEEIADISIIAVPGVGEISVQEAMIEQCERLKYRVALMDPEVGAAAPTLVDIQNQRRRFDSKYAAIYYPRIIIRDVADARRAIGAAGHMAGVCARVDNERGVFKAPGNETIRNIVDLEAILTKGEHEILNPFPNNINVIRDFREEGRGLRIYGARCITSDNDWKYLSVRRLFVFLERSLDIGTQWAVLEPNDNRLWDKLTDSVDSFLTTQWLAGALMGAKKEQAFYIRVGTSTMTQDDIDNGRLIMEIGIAPVKPAEFVIIRIGQWAGGSFAQEA